MMLRSVVKRLVIALVLVAAVGCTPAPRQRPDKGGACR